MKIPQVYYQKISLLSKIPDSLFLNLDFSGFRLPKQNIEEWRTELENKLDHFVVSYNSNYFNLKKSLESHLCALVKGASLTAGQLKLLNKYEKLSKPLGVTFVVYQKPLELINPYKSLLAGLYSSYKKGISA